MSGYAEPPIPDDVLLQKPVTPDALARKVAEVLRQPAPYRRDAVGAGPALAG
jgi:hypothetical protein